MTETLVQVEGRLESGSVPAFQARLAAAILVAAKRLGVSGGRLAIFAPPHIAEMFAVSGLDAVLPVRLSLAQAQEALVD